ncbi:MAG TPA: penicillin-binding transpeptidase domain-containing protein [Patescibacteria group bacterium]|nr:penicillin-binding transpeptidase domain-containing protein [Patescibacteria group bacterium]
MTDQLVKKNILLKIILVLGFLIIFGRLVELQVVKGNYYRNLSDGNRIRRVKIVAPRGEIYARGGEVVVGNAENPKRVFFDSQMGYIKESIPDSEKDMGSIVEYKRIYPMGMDSSHISGYLGKVTESELNKVDGNCPDKGVRNSEDWIGRSGLEQYYDCLLRGVDGEELIEVESNGQRVRTLGIKDPVKGGDLKTTLDFPLQEYIAKLLTNQKGAIVATDGFGEVLASYSSPSFDSSAFVVGNGDVISKIFADKDLPLLNRTIAGIYAPGSIFKPLVSLAALEEEKINPDWTYVDTGRISFQTIYGDYTYNNWFFTQYGGTEGKIEITKAIARSTDTFFYKVGEELGIDNLVNWARKLGLGSVTGIDIPGEVGGLVPDPVWKEKTKGERWFLGNTYHLAIGQGDLLVTPMQMNIATSVIANGGRLCSAHFASVGRHCLDLNIKSENLDLVKTGMEKACSTGGTGFTFFDFEEKHDIKVGCKTGTAEVGSDDETHAWFSVFAPIDNPQIVLTVLIEKGGEGSKVAGPIARDIFDFWFSKK